MKLRSLPSYALLAAFATVASVAAAADPEPPAHPPIRAARLTQPVNLDGILDEAVWQSPDPTTKFTQRDPNEGATPSQKSEVRIAWDDEAIYVAARLYDSAPDSILARLTRRDVSVPADQFYIFLDPFHDKRSGYYFSVNAGGTLYDGTVSNDGFEDSSWDGVWSGRARVDDQGWTAEMRIPFCEMRYQGGANPIWGVNFVRRLQRASEWDYLVYQPKNGQGYVSRFPELHGLENLRPSRVIQILPYVTSKAEFLQHDANDPFNDGSRFTGDVGADIRTGVGSRMTLNATVNPDFGQVEVDPAVVNLSDYESFFEEKRPFFVEGISNFRFGNEGANSYWGFNWPEPLFFYSRRIGRAPQGGLDAYNYDYANSPLGTTILGAAKLTGKISPTWNFGTLHAVTSKEDADMSLNGTRSEAEVEPLTYYGIARGLREFKDRRYGFGLLGDAVVRRFETGSLGDQLNKDSYVGGFDGWAFLDKKKVWVISGWTAMSHARGTATRITNLQRSSRHYFQRPDASQVEVDPTATSLTGWGSRYWLNKQEGKVIFNAALGAVAPGFDVNDLGFQSRSDAINGHAGAGYKWTDTTKWRKYQDFLVALFDTHNFGGDQTWGGVFANGSTEFINNYSWSYRFAYNPRTVSDRRTRGGPKMYNMPGYEYGMYIDTDGKAKIFYYLDTYMYTQPDAGSWNYGLYPGVEFKPVSNVTLRIGPSYERTLEDAQYVTTSGDPTATQTFGNRYVFATLDQKTFAANVRLNWAFSPDLSFQMFAQPLVSSGDYSAYKELAQPKSYDFLRYGENGSTFDPDSLKADPDGAGPAPAIYLDDPNFNYKSLRGNAVLRWEYMPGSTLFLVWTQTREDYENLGDFRFSNSISRLVEQRPNNIFLAKVTYYFTP